MAVSASRPRNCEFDDIPDEDDQAAIHWHLNKFAPLAMAVRSGNKSLHGWYCCDEEAEEKWR